MRTVGSVTRSLEIRKRTALCRVYQQAAGNVSIHIEVVAMNIRCIIFNADCEAADGGVAAFEEGSRGARRKSDPDAATVAAQLMPVEEDDCLGGVDIDAIAAARGQILRHLIEARLADSRAARIDVGRHRGAGARDHRERAYLE